MKKHVGFNKNTVTSMIDMSNKMVLDNQFNFEGVFVQVNGVEQVEAIIRNQHAHFSETKEYRTILVRMDAKLKRGDIVAYDNENYIVAIDLDNHKFYRRSQLHKCNQMLKWKDEDGIVREIGCIIDNSAYGNKASLDNMYLAFSDEKCKITTQDNEFTRKIKKGYRLMFEHSPNGIYKVFSIDVSFKKGEITFICKKDIARDEDDFESNLCSRTIDDVFEPIPSIMIIGDGDIFANEEVPYGIEPSLPNTTYVIEENSNAIIVSQSNGACIVKGLIEDEVFTLKAINGDEEIAYKHILIKRRR